MDIYQTVLSWQSIINSSTSKNTEQATDLQEAEAQETTLPSEPIERPVRPIIVSEVVEVIWKAIEAYMASTASMRGTRSSIRHLYEPHGPGKVRYTGPTAEDVLEDYLVGLGYNRGSRIWFDLARVVIDHAEQQRTEEPEVAFWCKINEVPFEP
jgi:hypothetical protein